MTQAINKLPQTRENIYKQRLSLIRNVYGDLFDAEFVERSPVERESKEPPDDDLLEAMRAIEHGLHRDRGNFWKLRAYLDKHNMYHGNLQEEAVILEVAQKAIREAERLRSSPIEREVGERWISVDERLPEEQEWVIACGEHAGERHVFPCFVRECSPAMYQWQSEFPVTHWMPLPSAPTGEKNVG